MNRTLSGWLSAHEAICPSWREFVHHDLPFDHLALRTFAHYGVGQDLGLDALSSMICQDMGYKVAAEYNLTEKKVRAYYLERQDYPKIFISELLWREFTEDVQKVLERVLSHNAPVRLAPWLFKGTRPWINASKEDYDAVAKESSYGAWLIAWGYVANHFAVHLSMDKSIALCKSLNLSMNGDGKVQGSKSVGLEQCSTKADQIVHPLFGAYLDGGFVEFVQRWQDPQDPFKLYSGFVEKSASKVMESTGER